MKKKRARLTGLWTVAGACALALAVGAAAKRQTSKAAAFAAGEELRDAVAAPAAPPTAALAGRPVPTSWFKAPSQRKAEMDSALLSSRKRRALARRVAVQ